MTFNHGVRGSIPRWITKKMRMVSFDAILILLYHIWNRTREGLCARTNSPMDYLLAQSGEDGYQIQKYLVVKPLEYVRCTYSTIPRWITKKE